MKFEDAMQAMREGAAAGRPGRDWFLKMFPDGLHIGKRGSENPLTPIRFFAASGINAEDWEIVNPDENQGKER